MESRIMQPRNASIRAGNTVVGAIEWSPSFSSRLNGRMGMAQQFVDSEVLRRSEPYLPFQTGSLRNSGILGSKIGDGEVVWNAPDAKFLYYGKVMVGVRSRSAWAKQGERKETTDQALTYHGGPKRGAFWFERMKADQGKAIISGAKRIAGGGT